MLHDDLGQCWYCQDVFKGQGEVFLAAYASGQRGMVLKLLAMPEEENSVPARRAPLQPIISSRPGELVTMDIVEYPLSSRG